MISFYRRHIQSMRAQDILFGNIEHGDDIMTANTIVSNICGFYLTLPVTIITCIVCSLIGWRNVIHFFPEGTGWFVLIFTLFAVIAICTSKLRKTSSDPHFYISYFKKFQKKDNEWLRKWKRYSVLIFVGSFLSVALSLGILMQCVIIHRNIYGPF